MKNVFGCTEEVVAEKQAAFSVADTLVKQKQLELEEAVKARTIAEVFLMAAGLPTPTTTDTIVIREELSANALAERRTKMTGYYCTTAKRRAAVLSNVRNYFNALGKVPTNEDIDHYIEVIRATAEGRFLWCKNISNHTAGVLSLYCMRNYKEAKL